MLFNFTLQPLNLVQPWGGPEKPSLHWFGLTDGQYWIQGGEHALFEYSPDAQALSEGTRYCDYQVVRLYEDVLEIAPHVIEPVPPSLFKYVSICHPAEWPAWPRQRASWLEYNADRDDDEFWDLMDASSTWIGHRTLTSLHLAQNPHFRMWSDHLTVHIEWDNSDQQVQGVSAWSAPQGNFQLPREAFVTELQSFHDRLMAEMASRVEQVLAGALSPGVEIDLVALKKEQVARSGALDHALNKSHAGTDWDRVAAAIKQIEGEATKEQI